MKKLYNTQAFIFCEKSFKSLKMFYVCKVSTRNYKLVSFNLEILKLNNAWYRFPYRFVINKNIKIISVSSPCLETIL